MTDATNLPMNNQLTRLVCGMAFEKFVLEVFPRKEWKFPFQSSPIFVPNASVAKCPTCEDAVGTWLSGINGNRFYGVGAVFNGNHYGVSVTALVRHFTHKGLIPEGSYLLLTHPKSYGVHDRLDGHELDREAIAAGASYDESTVEGPKGVA